jgi:hypothetical protein
MTRAIHQIKQDLAALEETVSVHAVELHKMYNKYLELLSKSAQKQLILASYQICTQEYPELFLNLPLNQKQKLQQNLRQLGKQISIQLLSCPPEKNRPQTPKVDENSMQQILSQLEIENEREENGIRDILPEIEANLFAEINEEEFERSPQLGITNPEELINWHKQIQHKINKTLENISKEVNRLLEEAKVLPHQLPTKVVEMAIQAEETGSGVAGSPNMLNLLLESENDSGSSDSKITKVVAIRLRLSEIEFSDPALSAEGNQIRNLLVNISKLRQQYQKKQRECAIAEAEAAWRSSWFDE